MCDDEDNAKCGLCECKFSFDDLRDCDRWGKVCDNCYKAGGCMRKSCCLFYEDNWLKYADD